MEAAHQPFSMEAAHQPFSMEAPWKLLINPFPWKLLINPFPWKLLINPFPWKLLINPFPWKLLINPFPWKLLINPFPWKLLINPFPWGHVWWRSIIPNYADKLIAIFGPIRRTFRPDSGLKAKKNRPTSKGRKGTQKACLPKPKPKWNLHRHLIGQHCQHRHSGENRNPENGAGCSFLETGLRRCDEGFCSFRLRNLTHCRLPKQTLGFSRM